MAGFLIAFLAGLAVLVGYGLKTERPVKRSDSAPGWNPVAEMRANSTACQAPVYREGPFSTITIAPDRPEAAARRGRRRPPLAVTVDGVRSGRRYATASFPADRQPGGPRTVALPRRLSVDEPLSVCVRNRGPEPVVLWGVAVPAEGFANPYVAGVRLTQTVGTLDGQRLPGDVAIELGLPGEPPRSLAELVPNAFERAARFKPPFVGAWTFWLLLGAMVLVAPVLLLAGLADARREPEPAEPF